MKTPSVFHSLAAAMSALHPVICRLTRAILKRSYIFLLFLLGSINLARSEEFVGDITRFSPSVGQPLFPVGNINVFKQFAFQFGEKLTVGKTVDTVILGTFGAEATGEVAAAMGFEFGLCFGGNADYDLGFKPRISVPDNIPYEFPLTLHVDEGLMADSSFTTNFPPLGKAYADLIFDITLEAKFKACVFGCLNFTLFALKTADLGGMTYMNLPLGAIVPSGIAGLFAKSVRCDPTVDAKAFTSIELASWNRGEDNKFKMLNVFAKSAAEFLAEPTLEFGGGFESGGGGEFTVDADTDILTTGGSKFKSGDAVVVKTSEDGRLPGGLAAKKVYYVVGANFLGDGTAFKLARRKGGSALDILNTGSGTHEINANDPKNSGNEKRGGFDSFGKISITAPTVSTDSSVSEIDSSERNFNVLVDNVIRMEPKVNIASGLEGFPNGAKVRVKKDGTNELPDGLNAACVYYVINAKAPSLLGQEFQLATSVQGPPVEISPSVVTNKIVRNAEFNSADGLSSTGAEDVAAVTIDVVKLVNEVAFKASPLKMQAVYDLGVASVDYKLISLELGPAIQLQTDFKMSWDLVVDDILFTVPGTIADPAKVRFVEKVHENAEVVDFSSLKSAFPGRVFHLTNRGAHKIPEIALLNADEVCVTIMYDLKPKLKTKVSAPILGRVKYEALEVGAQIEYVGGIRLGPLVEGEHQFKLGEFTFYDGNPFPLDEGKVEPRTDFEQSDDLDRYALVLVDETNGETTPETGCAEIVITRTGTSGLPSDLELKIFDAEGEVIENRRGSVMDLLPETGATLADLLKDWPTPAADEKAKIMKNATKQASLSPGVMKFELKAAGPADYHWNPLAKYKASGETDFAKNNKTAAEIEILNTYDSAIDAATGGTKGYPQFQPTGVMSYGYIQPGNSATATAWETEYNKEQFVLFPANSWFGAAPPTGLPPVLVHLDARGLLSGPIAAWANKGRLGGEFRAEGDPMVESIKGAKGVTLDGSGDWLIGPTSIPSIEGSSPRSIEAWVYNPQVAVEETVVSWGRRGGPDGTNMAFIYGSAADYGAAVHWGLIDDIGWNGRERAGEWTHIAYTQDGTTTRVYLNGSLVNSEEGVTLNTHGGQGILIGAQWDNESTVNEAFSGSLTVGLVRIYEGVLSDAQVWAVYGENQATFSERRAVPEIGRYLYHDMYMDASTSIARGLDGKLGEVWPVRRWTSPGGPVDVKWGVAMYPGVNALPRAASAAASPQASDGVTGALYVNGKLIDSYATAEASSHYYGPDELSFELDFHGEVFTPFIVLRNTGGVTIKDFFMNIYGDKNSFGLLSDASSLEYGASAEFSSDQRSLTMRFASGLPPGEEFKFQLSFWTLIEIGLFFPIEIPTLADYRELMFNNGVVWNSVATVTGMNDANAYIAHPEREQPNAFPMEPAYRFRSSSIRTSEVTSMQKNVVTLDLKKGDVVDLVLSPKGPNRPAGNSNDGWQDVAVTVMEILGPETYEWASAPDTPTNWAEFLSNNAPHQPNAYPGAIGSTSNLATIDRIDSAPYPTLTSTQTVGTLQVMDSARLTVMPPVAEDATLNVRDGAVANSGTINVFQSNGGKGTLILGGPGVSDISLTGSGTLKLRGDYARLEAWRDPDTNAPAPEAVNFINYNAIEGPGRAMELLSTHPASKSSITNVGAMRGGVSTSANRFVNRGELSSGDGGFLLVAAERFENRFGANVEVSGEGSHVFFTVDESANSGLFHAHDKGLLTLAPRTEKSSNLWFAGQDESSEQRGTFLAEDATLTLTDTKASGGSWIVRGGGTMRTFGPVTGIVALTGSNVDIGDYDPAGINANSGSLTLNATSNLFTGVALRNFGQVTVSGGARADVIDGRLFENHGTLRVEALGSMRFREISQRTVDPNAAEIATRFPGLANATGETLLGGTWDIAGELLIDGAAITKIGADVQSDVPSVVTDGAGNPVPRRESLDSQICALSLCQPASVTLRGPNAAFPALDCLSVNSGTLNLLDGASMPRVPSPLLRTDGDFATYRLALMSVNAPADLVAAETSLVVVALVGPELHVRIFDAAGNAIVDKTETELIGGQDRSWLKGLVSNDPFPDASTFSQEAVVDIIERARSVSGYADFFNRGDIVVSGGGSLEIGGGYHQSGGSLSVLGTSEISSATGEFVFNGGDVTVESPASIFLPGTTIIVHSPFVRADVGFGRSVEITPVSVNFGGGISRIDAGVSLTLHGNEITFPRTITANAGTFIIKGDHGLDNRGDYRATDPFTNTGTLSILGDSSEFFCVSSFTQSGDGSRTRIGAGATLKVNGPLNLSGGELVLDIQGRPHNTNLYGFLHAGGQANLNDRLVINFGGEFLKGVRPDVGDTWEIMSRKIGATITGFENTTFRVDGLPLPADWLPAGTHLEMVQLPTSFDAPRGLAVRVAPDAGWILYDDWVKAHVGGASMVSDYAAYLQDYYFGSNLGGERKEWGDIQQGLVELDGREYYTLTYARRKGVDATFATYSSVDLKNWYPAPMAVEQIMVHDDGSGLETVTLRSTFDLPDHRLFLQVRGLLNLDNAPLGLVPQKPIQKSSGSGLRNFEQYLIQQVFNIPLERRNGGAYHPDDIEAAAQQLPYRIVPGRVLYFRMTGDYDDGKNGVSGGTAANGVDRDFIYQDKTIIGGMVIHAGLLNDQESRIVKVTFLERQPTFLGSQQESPDGRHRVTSTGKTSEAAEKNELFSLRVEAYEDPFAGN